MLGGCWEAAHQPPAPPRLLTLARSLACYDARASSFSETGWGISSWEGARAAPAFDRRDQVPGVLAIPPADLERDHAGPTAREAVEGIEAPCPEFQTRPQPPATQACACDPVHRNLEGTDGGAVYVGVDARAVDALGLSRRGPLQGELLVLQVQESLQSVSDCRNALGIEKVLARNPEPKREGVYLSHCLSELQLVRPLCVRLDLLAREPGRFEPTGRVHLGLIEVVW